MSKTRAIHKTAASPHINTSGYWSSRLFHEVYLAQDLPRDFASVWDSDRFDGYAKFEQKFINLVLEDLHNLNPKNWSETDTITNLIMPMMDVLGWHDKCAGRRSPAVSEESFTVIEDGCKRTFRPDLIYVDKPEYTDSIRSPKLPDEKILAAHNKTTGAMMVVEAKYWDRLEEYQSGDVKGNRKRNDVAGDEGTKSLSPDDQILKYMDILGRDFGILTDGKTWRLFHKDLSKGDFRKKYYEFDVGNLISLVKLGLDRNVERRKEFQQAAKYFYFFFSKETFYRPIGDRKPLIYEVLEFSKVYSQSLEEDLKKRFIVAMGHLCNGYAESIRKSRQEISLESVRAIAESSIFNILFIRSCEVRGVLPMRAPDYIAVSLTDIINRLDKMDYEPQRMKIGACDDFFKSYWGSGFSADGFEIYDRVLNLYNIVHQGTTGRNFGFEIQGFNESIFTKEEWRHVTKFKIANKYMLDCLFHLSFIKADKSIKDRKFQQIPYNFFSPRQLGSIYESFLEYKIKKAENDLMFQDGEWKNINLRSKEAIKLEVSSEDIVKEGDLYFTTDNKTRKLTGSYYTPDCVSKYIIKKCLADSIKNKTPEKILAIKVCDPASGSGHFLTGALETLTDSYRLALVNQTIDDISESYEESARKVLAACIYGVDLNPSAIKLAKMALWLATAQKGQKLEPLQEQIFCADSLSFGSENSVNSMDWGKLIELKTEGKGFDAVIGNPPYLGEKGHKELFDELKSSKIGREYYNGKMDLFYFFFHLGFDILKANGRLGFITTNYFVTADGAIKLRSDMKRRMAFEVILNFNEMKVFDSATGQHNMVSILKKTPSGEQTIVIQVRGKGKVTEDVIAAIENGDESLALTTRTDSSSIFEGDCNYIRLKDAMSNGSVDDDALLARIRTGADLLGNICEVRTGIQTGVDKVSDKHLNKFNIKNAESGDGVFCLKKAEVAALGKLNSKDEGVLKPFFKNSDVRQFNVNSKPEQFIVYLDKKDGGYESLGKIKTHLEKFRQLIDDSSSNSPYLHRPRKREMFEGEKIVCPQRSTLNTFGYNNTPWFASVDVYFITASAEKSVPLKYVLGILNSKLGYYWLYHRGKRKGDTLELYETPLSEIPIKLSDKGRTAELVNIVSEVIKEIKKGDASDLLDSLNQIVYEIYGLGKKERKVIEDLFDAKIKAPQSLYRKSS